MRHKLATAVALPLALPGIIAVLAACCLVLAACAVVLACCVLALPGVLAGRLIGGPNWQPGIPASTETHETRKRD